MVSFFAFFVGHELHCSCKTSSDSGSCGRSCYNPLAGKPSHIVLVIRSSIQLVLYLHHASNVEMLNQ